MRQRFIVTACAAAVFGVLIAASLATRPGHTAVTPAPRPADTSSAAPEPSQAPSCDQAMKMSFTYTVKNEVVKLELFNIMRPNGDVLDPNYFNIQIKGNTASWDKGHFVATRALVPFNEAETIGQPYPVEDGSITVTLPLPNSNKVFTQMVIVEGYNPTFTTESGC